MQLHTTAAPCQFPAQWYVGQAPALKYDHAPPCGTQYTVCSTHTRLASQPPISWSRPGTSGTSTLSQVCITTTINVKSLFVIYCVGCDTTQPSKPQIANCQGAKHSSRRTCTNTSSLPSACCIPINSSSVTCRTAAASYTL
jgi:hypothetical protein